MNHPVDKRGVLEDEIFSWKTDKDGKVFLFWHGKQVKILSDEEAGKFMSRIKAASPKEAQLIMAKATGNFKRGNERAGKRSQGK